MEYQKTTSKRLSTCVMVDFRISFDKHMLYPATTGEGIFRR